MGYQTVFRRYEKKYLVTQEQYDRLAKVFAPRMERDRFSESTISNIYYDTPDFRLIRRSLDRPVYKEKLRLRTYRTPHAEHVVHAGCGGMVNSSILHTTKILDPSLDMALHLFSPSLVAGVAGGTVEQRYIRPLTAEELAGGAPQVATTVQ